LIVHFRKLQSEITAKRNLFRQKLEHRPYNGFEDRVYRRRPRSPTPRWDYTSSLTDLRPSVAERAAASPAQLLDVDTADLTAVQTADLIENELRNGIGK